MMPKSGNNNGNNKKRAYLIDSSIYIFRGWHVYPVEMTDMNGNPANAIYGFTEFLQQLIELEQPEYIACAFDASHTDSYRREIYPEYKANRPPAPAELKSQFRHCRDFCRAAGIATFPATDSKPTTSSARWLCGCARRITRSLSSAQTRT